MAYRYMRKGFGLSVTKGDCSKHYAISRIIANHVNIQRKKYLFVVRYFAIFLQLFYFYAI